MDGIAPASGPSVRQCGPGLARGLARQSRRAVAGIMESAFPRTCAALLRRGDTQLRAVEARRLLRQLRAAFAPLAVTTLVSKDDAFELLASEALGEAMLVSRIGAQMRRWSTGGWHVRPSHAPIATVSRHAQERLHLRLSTTEWLVCGRELEALLAAEGFADVARARGFRSIWVPSAHGALCLALDEALPTVVTFLDELNARQAALVEPVRECLGAERAVAKFELLLGRPEYGRWRRGDRG